MINICPEQGEENQDENEGKISEKGTKMHRIITKWGEKHTGFSEPNSQDEDLYHVLQNKSQST
jgi:hypothetical protein